MKIPELSQQPQPQQQNRFYCPIEELLDYFIITVENISFWKGAISEFDFWLDNKNWSLIERLEKEKILINILKTKLFCPLFYISQRFM